jgi:aspartyl-tRNA(Asn)/glutamyl-tRNA(Gln) amidotransferase subunit C
MAALLNKETIKKLTQLCRIDCTEEEENLLLIDLENILNYIDQLDQIDTSNVLPLDYVLEDVVNVMREDEVGVLLKRETFLENAPSHVAGMIRVPQVIKQSS